MSRQLESSIAMKLSVKNGCYQWKHHNACVLGAPGGAPWQHCPTRGSSETPPGGHFLCPWSCSSPGEWAPFFCLVRSTFCQGWRSSFTNEDRLHIEADCQTQTILWKHLCHFAVSQVSNPRHGTGSMCSLLWFKQFLWNRSKKLKKNSFVL